MKIIFLVLCTLTFNFSVIADNILNYPPKDPKTNEHYIFYSHGLIVEGKNPIPKHDRFGLYDFPSVKNALSDPKYNLIAYHRPLKTDPVNYANLTSDRVKR